MLDCLVTGSKRVHYLSSIFEVLVCSNSPGDADHNGFRAINAEESLFEHIVTYVTHA